MTTRLILLLLSTIIFFTACQQGAPDMKNESKTPRPEYVLVIHGGAGTILKKNMTSEKEAAYLEALGAALDAGEEILKNGGDALDAVEASVRTMEDSPLFNAGKGAVFTHDGTNELDASIMRGEDLACGAIAGVKHVKNPITLARNVMENSEHVFLSGNGAESFAEQLGIELVDSNYFRTDSRWESLQKALKLEEGSSFLSEDESLIDEKFGTVGAVALDINGHLAAATSTGGMTNKRWGRIGDSPVIGAGTYADDRSCAVSCTGHGEFFIRLHIASRVAASMKFGGASLEEASNSIINSELADLGGSGGLIAVDNDGNIAMPFNTAGMYRAYTNGIEREMAIYSEEQDQ